MVAHAEVSPVKYALGVFFVLHGIAHLVGFVVPWRLATLPDAPYHTTLLDGRLDVGAAGMRAIGILWLFGAILFAAAGAGVMMQPSWWRSLALAAAVFSLAMSVLGWPEARIGVVINMVILGVLLAGARLGWSSAPA
jgi:hypothetical protein